MQPDPFLATLAWLFVLACVVAIGYWAYSDWPTMPAVARAIMIITVAMVVLGLVAVTAVVISMYSSYTITIHHK